MRNTNKNAKPWPARLSSATRLLPIAVSMMIWTGCARYKVISADRTVHPLRAGEAWVAPVDGWFVPDARWLEIREAIANKVEELENYACTTPHSH